MNSEVINDFIIPAKDEEESENLKGRHFQIWFDQSGYKVKDLGIGYGIFYKLTQPIVSICLFDPARS